MLKRKIKIAIIILSAVTAFIVVFFYNNSKMDSNSSTNNKSTSKIICVNAISQYPDLPTGCETVSAVMALNFWGENISHFEFVEKWLVCGDLYTKNDKIYGPDPNVAFIGSPFSRNGFGCYANVIVRAINGNSQKCKAENISGNSLDLICRKYIDWGKPVMIWATMNMKAEKTGRSWYINDNEKFTWIAGEHCMLLVGYDESNYYFNDPIAGRLVKYEKSLSEKRYNALGKQAVLVYK